MHRSCPDNQRFERLLAERSLASVYISRRRTLRQSEAESWDAALATTRGNRSHDPRTLREVDLPARIRRATGPRGLRETGRFFGWLAWRVTKHATDFDDGDLLSEGWTSERLLDVAEGYELVARITPANPSAAVRARQLREIAARLAD